MRNLFISLLTASILALSGAAVLADDDDDDRRGRWQRPGRGNWDAPRVDPRFDDWYGRPIYRYDDRIGYPPWQPYPPPTFYSPWEYEQFRYGNWRWHPEPPYRFRYSRPWPVYHGDDDDDDYDDD